jgi:hypothetical protein
MDSNLVIKNLFNLLPNLVLDHTISSGNDDTFSFSLTDTNTYYIPKIDMLRIVNTIHTILAFEKFNPLNLDNVLTTCNYTGKIINETSISHSNTGVWIHRIFDKKESDRYHIKLNFKHLENKMSSANLNAIADLITAILESDEEIQNKKEASHE